MNDLISFDGTKTTPAVRKAMERLPELVEQTKAFGRSNSQTTLSMISLTMLNGCSPYRLLRQVLAEVDRRRTALAEAQHNHAKTKSEIVALKARGDLDEVGASELRMKQVNLASLENNVMGAFKDIATLIDAYDNIRAKHGITEWDEAAFEAEEKRFNVRRGFELLYRNIVENGRPSNSMLEYLQQFGVHPQIACAEVMGYATTVEQRIAKGERMTASDLEKFLDQMAEKYLYCADEAATRLFGKSDFANSDYMMRNVKT